MSKTINAATTTTMSIAEAMSACNAYNVALARVRLGLADDITARINLNEINLAISDANKKAESAFKKAYKTAFERIIAGTYSGYKLTENKLGEYTVKPCEIEWIEDFGASITIGVQDEVASILKAELSNTQRKLKLGEIVNRLNGIPFEVKLSNPDIMYIRETVTSTNKAGFTVNKKVNVALTRMLRLKFQKADYEVKVAGQKK